MRRLEKKLVYEADYILENGIDDIIEKEECWDYADASRKQLYALEASMLEWNEDKELWVIKNFPITYGEHEYLCEVVVAILNGYYHRISRHRYGWTVGYKVQSVDVVENIA